MTKEQEVLAQEDLQKYVFGQKVVALVIEGDSARILLENSWGIEVSPVGVALGQWGPGARRVQ